LELIDEEVLQYGTLLVKCDDHLMAKKYGHRSTPALVFFRHGKIIHFEGIYTCSSYFIKDKAFNIVIFLVQVT